ncbi:MAG: hypothetical protein HXY28_14135 [Hydrogenophilaceae bacterium]|jgi:hypothetical protein|nr:hypothetical protein [Hydrogenophilaceae bacterium]
MKTPIALAALLALAAAAFAAEIGVARPGGVFRTANVIHADACRQLCAGDGLCMAWTYDAPSQECELKAVVPAATPSAHAVSGVMSRAGVFAQAAAPQPPAPPTPPASPEQSVIPAVAARNAAADGDEELLGGDEDLGLRLRMADDS